MRTFFLLLLGLALAVSAGASRFGLGWNASPTPGVITYTLHAHTNLLTATNLTEAVRRIDVGTNLTVIVEDIVPGRWWFTVTARTVAGLESAPVPSLLVDVPAMEGQMRLLIIQHGATITNFNDIGVFRLRIE
jgi:hypothetical protein